MEKLVNQIVAEIGKVLIGKELQIRKSLTCLFAGGHLLLEDLPGMGKTTLAHALANVLGLSYNRIQFTSDLLPADILGVSVFDQKESSFRFHEGPVFTQLLLADEINRTTPKTQSALLEAMAEGQVTIEGQTRDLPNPFFVIATQNPRNQSGTFPLPESQLDRFLMKLELGYPSPEAELKIFKGIDPSRNLDRVKQLLTPEKLVTILKHVDKVTASDSVLGYLHRLVNFTRTDADFAYGVSTRGALALLRCAKTWALMSGRDHLLPDDIQLMMPDVIGHRLRDGMSHSEEGGYALVAKALDQVDVLGE